MGELTVLNDRFMRLTVVGGEIRMAVIQRLAAAEGLDGDAAYAAVAHAIRDDRSPWAPAFDAAFEAVTLNMIVRPMFEAMESLRASLVPALVSVARALEQINAGSWRFTDPAQRDAHAMASAGIRRPVLRHMDTSAP